MFQEAYHSESPAGTILPTSDVEGHLISLNFKLCFSPQVNIVLQDLL